MQKAITTITPYRRSFGYRRMIDLVPVQGFRQPQQIFQLYQDANMVVGTSRRKRRLPSMVIPLAAAERINEVWNIDFYSDSLANGRRIKCLTVADDFSHECVELAADFGMGGLWESWRAPDGEVLRTCCCITTGPSKVMDPIHDRMPVIIAPEDWKRWLSGPVEDVEELVRLYGPETMCAWPVDRRVSKTVDDDPELIKPEYSLKELMEQMPLGTRLEEIDWGPDVGREIIE